MEIYTFIFFKVFYVFNSYIESLIHFKLIFVYVSDNGPNLFFCMCEC